jgi:hypothetical protein
MLIGVVAGRLYQSAIFYLIVYLVTTGGLRHCHATERWSDRAT